MSTPSDDFLGVKRKPSKMSRSQLRAFSLIGMVSMVIFAAVYLWSAHDQTTWPQTDATVTAREKSKYYYFLTVRFTTPDGRSASGQFREWDLSHSVGETVRIRYDLNSSGSVDDARLVGEPVVVRHEAIGVGLLFLFPLVVGYWWWFRMPVPARRRR
ncbi:DUF3592 domain-containing protein [Kibdelosporangium aridum]|uniref:DUF3592 domain-containing protein n=1 Tax=Kibdelosporangium aridum TaxID=2030 RepID=UPI0035E89946